jgi:hypothetical protein
VDAIMDRIARGYVTPRALRAANARVVDAHDEFVGPAPRVVLMCECSGTDCVTMVECDRATWDELKSGFVRFVVAPGHVADLGEHVVEQRPDHWVVELVTDAAIDADHRRGAAHA